MDRVVSTAGLLVIAAALSCAGSPTGQGPSAADIGPFTDDAGADLPAGDEARSDPGASGAADTGEAAADPENPAPDPGAPADPGFGGKSFGSPCTAHEQCEAGWCVEAESGSLCTVDCVDLCPDGWSCKLVRLGGGQDQTSVCVPGAEVSRCDAVDCDDGEICTEDSCDPEIGCVSTPRAARCADGDPCTTGDRCSEGRCGGEPRDCDDGDLCTHDVCEAGFGCVHTHNEAPCEDSLICTVGEQCEAGVCSGGAPGGGDRCACELAEDCPDPADKCAPSYACIEGACVAVEGTRVLCDASDDTPCQRSVCDAATGRCEPRAMGPDVSCDDGDPCTDDDRCDWEGDCQGEPLQCDDGAFCNGSESCDKATGGCVAGPPPEPPGAVAPCTKVLCDEDHNLVTNVPEDGACDDRNPCTDDRCSPVRGCVHDPNVAPCDDGDSCTGGDICEGGECRGDEDLCPCESDADCAGEGGGCFGEQECREGSCETRAGTGSPCAPSGACVRAYCSPEEGSCAEEPIREGVECDDDNPCTEFDACDNSGACRGRPLPCDDGLFCNGRETCEPEAGCRSGVAPSVDDNIACTVDICDESADAVVHRPDPSSCHDGEACTDDTCDPTASGSSADGCVHTNNAAACSDGNRCTYPDVCAAGSCQPGAAVECDDRNSCTSDRCDPAIGCMFTALAPGQESCPP
jgi:hypothetical protein